VKNFFDKLFGRSPKTPPETTPGAANRFEDEGTIPLDPVQATFSPPPVRSTKLTLSQLASGCGQDVGRQRDHNEDALFSLTTTLITNSNHLLFGLYIVADGMGGHQHGELASEIAVNAMAGHVIQHLYTPLLSIDPSPPTDTLQEIMTSGVQLAHEKIVERVSGGGTTLTCVVVLGKQMIIAHVGDSRVCTIDLHGNLHPLTRDHSLVKRLEELGQLTPEEAAIHPQRNVLYRALGQGEPFEPEIITAPLPSPGYLLICSDGLWGVVPDQQLGEIALSAPSPQVACQQMIDAANEAGGPDNITAILVQLPD